MRKLLCPCCIAWAISWTINRRTLARIQTQIQLSLYLDLSDPTITLHTNYQSSTVRDNYNQTQTTDSNYFHVALWYTQPAYLTHLCMPRLHRPAMAAAASVLQTPLLSDRFNFLYITSITLIKWLTFLNDYTLRILGDLLYSAAEVTWNI